MSFFNNCCCRLFCCRPICRPICKPCCPQPCCKPCCPQPCCRPCHSQPCGCHSHCGSPFPIQSVGDGFGGASDGFGGAENGFNGTGEQQNENFQPNAMNN